MSFPQENANRSGHGYADRLVAVACRAAIVLILSLAACTSRPPTTHQESGVPAAQETPSVESSGPTPEEIISDLQQTDLGSPEALNDRLEYAGQLIAADDADCQKRLSLAQSELDVVSADPSFNVVLPLGRARRADLQYRLHAARASCKAEAPQRLTELQQALAAAQQAVDLYRDALDYEAMTVAQFNVAATQRLLGDDGASLASLETAIALDKEFGLRQDAIDNAGLLARWRAGGGSKSDSTAAGTVDFPARTVTLNLWFPTEAQVSVQADEAIVLDGGISRGHVHRTFEQHVQFRRGAWVVSYQPGEISYDVAQWPQKQADLRELAVSFERAMGIPTFQVGMKGKFERVRDLSAFSSQQLAAARALALEHTIPASGTVQLSEQQLQIMQIALRSETIRVEAEEDYDLQVGMWIGATLEQGVWYRLAAPLTLPGAHQLLIPYDLEFAYTRDVPCTGAATQRACVEIVVHASPQAHSIKSLMGNFDYPFVKAANASVHYWSATCIRIVTDPETLGLRVYDVRRYWHVSDKRATREPVENRFERIVTTFDYP